MSEPIDSYDVIVIGAGIAGASVAAELKLAGRVLLLEAENQPGYHTTGRSAALYTQTYGPPIIRALTRASWQFFDDPQSAYIDHPLLQQRGVLFIARADQTAAVEEMRAELGKSVQMLSAKEVLNLVPLLRHDYIAQGLFEPMASDVDVAALHQHFLKTFRANDGDLRTNAAALDMAYDGENWVIETTQGKFQAPIVVNAAGAWADEIAKLAGATPIGLVPKRRTALLLTPPDNLTVDRWPMVVDIDEQFYLKPDAGKLLVSPADESPSAPCDAQPDEMDVAICVDRIETAFDISVRRIDHKWAGLRNFVADKLPVCGFDPAKPGFFWLAGQGGYGIQTSPALARLAAALLQGHDIPEDIIAEGVTPDALSPKRQQAAV